MKSLELEVLQRGDLTRRLYSELKSAERIAWDIETSGLDPKCDSMGTVQIYSERTGSVIVKVDSRRPTRVCQLLENDRVEKVFHHAMFDLRFMVANWSVEPRNIGCTKIASKLLNPDDGAEHTLQSLLNRYLGVEIDKVQRMSDWMAHELTDEQLEYAADDVRYLLPLVDVLTEGLEKRELYSTYRSCKDFVPTRVLLDLGQWSDVFLY